MTDNYNHNITSKIDMDSVTYAAETDLHTQPYVALSNPNPDIGKITSLLKNGADPNIKYGSDHKTALHVALSDPNPNVEIIKLLLENKADPNIKCGDNHRTALHVALSDPNPNVKIIELLLGNGADPNIKCGDNHRTALHVALNDPNPNVKIIELLLKNGADPNIKCGDNHRTALHVALSDPNPNVEIIELLLQNRANLNIQDINNETPFVLMIKNRELWCDSFQGKKSYITKEKVDIDYRYRCKEGAINVDGDNYLHISARERNKDAFCMITQFFEEKEMGKMGKMLGQMNNGKDGNTPLHEAAVSGILFDVVESLIRPIQEKVRNAEPDLQRDLKNIKEYWQEKFKERKKFVREKLKRMNRDGKSPIACLGSKESQKKLKGEIGIIDPLLPRLVRSRTLVTITAILAAAAFFATLYILHIYAPNLALNVIALQTGSCSTFMLYKVYSMNNQDVINHTLLGDLDVESELVYDSISLSSGMSI